MFERGLDALQDVLVLDDRHHLHLGFSYAVIDRMLTTHAAAIAFFDLINSAEKTGVLAQNFKMLEQIIIITIRLLLTPTSKSLRDRVHEDLHGQAD